MLMFINNNVLIIYYLTVNVFFFQMAHIEVQSYVTRRNPHWRKGVMLVSHLSHPCVDVWLHQHFMMQRLNDVYNSNNRQMMLQMTSRWQRHRLLTRSLERHLEETQLIWHYFDPIRTTQLDMYGSVSHDMS